MFYLSSIEWTGLNTSYTAGAESGGDETASKKKRRSKPRGGRGHGGKSKPESKHAAKKFVSFFSRTVVWLCVYPAAEGKNPEGGDPPVGPGTAARGTGCRIPNAGPGQLAPTSCP